MLAFFSPETRQETSRLIFPCTDRNSVISAETREGKKAASALRAPAAPSTALQIPLPLLLSLHLVESQGPRRSKS